MATKIDTVTSRDDLKARHAPYWHKLSKGCFLGFRKVSDQSAGAWLALYRDEGTGKRTLHSLKSFDTVTPADRFTAAKKAAEVWFAHRDAGGSNDALTVKAACERYVTHLRAGGREKTAIDAEARFKRWVYPHTKFSKTQLLKLTPGVVNDWRMKLASSKAIPQDKTKAATEPRAASSLNRDMSTLKAALNLAKEDGHATSSHAWDTKLKPVVNAGSRREFYLSLEQRK